MNQALLLQIGTFFIAAIPSSLILINIFTKLFSKHHPKLANATSICTTIVGTLTKAQTSVKTIIFDKYELTAEENSHLVHLEDTITKEETRIEKKHLQKEENIKLMTVTITLCHYHKMHEIETLISKFFKSCAIDTQNILDNYEIISNIPSNEEKKISTVVASKKETKEIFAFTKGNPKKILDKCTRILIGGKKIDIDIHLRRKLRKKIEKLTKRGEKIIAFAYKPLPFKRLDHYSESFAENDLVLIGLIGLGNLPNTTLAPYIEAIKKAGIKIYILSSSKELLVLAIANELKLINPHYFESIIGRDIRDLNEQKLRKMLQNKEKDYIFSELKAADRERIIKTLQSLGETVIFINKKSKIGIRDVLGEIKYQRQHNKNQHKLKFHALSCKIAELILLSCAVIFKAPLPLTIGLILIVDLLINTFLELSLYRSPTEENNQINYYHLLFTGFVSGIILSSIYLWSLMRFGWYPGEKILPEALIKSVTIVFLLLIVIQILNTFNLNSLKQSIIKIKPLTNPYLILTTILVFLIIYILTNFPFFEEYFGLTMTSFLEWQIIIFMGFLIIIIEEIRKYLTRKNEIPENQSDPQKLQK